MPINFSSIKQSLSQSLANKFQIFGNEFSVRDSANQVLTGFKTVTDKILDPLKESIGRTISITNEPEKTEDEDFNIRKQIRDAIGQYETQEFGDTPDKAYSSAQDAPLPKSPKNRALGRYRVTTDELQTYGERYLGHIPTEQEFLNNPSLQDKYMDEKLKDQRKQGAKNEDLIVNHRGGINAKIEERQGYLNAVKKFLPSDMFNAVEPEVKTTEGIITQAISKLRSFDIKEVNQFLDELPVLGNIRNFMKKLRPESEEEAFKQGMINLGSKENPVYFDITGAVGSLKSVGKEGAKQVLKKVASKIQSNLTKLNVSPKIKTHIIETVNQIRPELETIKGGILKNIDVIESAQKSDILRRVVSKEATLKSEAALLRTRQHLAKLAEGQTLTPDFIDTLRIVSSEATKRGRALQALGIEADPALGSIKTKIVKELVDIGKSTDEIIKASEGVDFTNAEQVAKFYRQFVKPTLPEIIDEYRYINLLSSPKTHIVNAFSNILQTTLLRPVTRLASGVVDTIASKLTGKAQQYYVSQVPAYYKGVANSFGDAISGFAKAFSGESLIARPDIKQIPTGTKLLKPFQSIPKLLEASDVFFRTLATGGEMEALMSKGITEAQAIRQSADTAAELVFRKALDPSNKTGQGVVLASIDKLTNAVYGLRKVPLVKWFVPFVQTPMNILKQGIEYSPLGITTLAGNANKIEQLGKTMVGSTVFAGAGWLALNDRITWAAPIAEKEKEAFYAAGMQPYSVKIGDKWVSYSRLGPLAYPIAMAAAVKYYTQQNPNAVSDSDLQKTTKILTGIAGFFADQSYVQGLGDFVDVAKGDTTATTRALTNIPSQLIPLASLQRWVANLIDPVYRKTGTKLSVESIIQNLEKGIPFLSKNLEAYKTPFGTPSKRQFPTLNAVSPIGITKEDKFFKGSLDLIQQKKRLDNIKKDLKEKLKQRIAPNL